MNQSEAFNLMNNHFHKFLPAIQNLKSNGPYSKKDLLTAQFLMDKEGPIEMYYAPHNEYVNRKAAVVIAGITPGWKQMKSAFEQVRKSLENSQETEQILIEAKKAGGLAGSIRTNLDDMLDQCGVPDALGIESASFLFGEQRSLLHTTSIIKYPVFYQGKNYTGHQPRIHQSAMLSYSAFKIFPEELNLIQSPALVVPLGKTVDHVIKQLQDEGKIPNHTYIFGFPHPSGANGHRKKQFEQNKESLFAAVQNWANHFPN